MNMAGSIEVLDDLYLFVSKVSILVVIYLFSYFGFFTLRDNKYSKFLPFLSVAWFLIIILFLYQGILDSMFTVLGTDMVTLVYALSLLPTAFIFTGLIRLNSYSAKSNNETKHSWIEIIIMSQLPVLLLLSYLHYFEYQFLRLDHIIFFLIVLIDKVLILMGNAYFLQTGFKLLVFTRIIFNNSYHIPGDMIVLITDCMIGYIILQAKQMKSKTFTKHEKNN